MFWQVFSESCYKTFSLIRLPISTTKQITSTPLEYLRHISRSVYIRKCHTHSKQTSLWCHKHWWRVVLYDRLHYWPGTCYSSTYAGYQPNLLYTSASKNRKQLYIQDTPRQKVQISKSIKTFASDHWTSCLQNCSHIFLTRTSTSKKTWLIQVEQSNLAYRPSQYLFMRQVHCNTCI